MGMDNRVDMMTRSFVARQRKLHQERAAKLGCAWVDVGYEWLNPEHIVRVRFAYERDVVIVYVETTTHVGADALRMQAWAWASVAAALGFSEAAALHVIQEYQRTHEELLRLV